MADITVKVAAVLDRLLVAFNAGSQAGVNVGDKVTIWRSVALFDPDTNAALGGLRMQKLGLEIIHVQETLSVGRVADLAESDQLYAVTVAGWQRRKQITQDPDKVDINTVLIRVGDEVTISTTGVGRVEG